MYLDTTHNRRYYYLAPSQPNTHRHPHVMPIKPHDNNNNKPFYVLLLPSILNFRFGTLNKDTYGWVASE